MPDLTESEAARAISVNARNLSKLIGFSVRWIEERTRAGEIPHRKIGRSVTYIVSEIREWMHNQPRPGGVK